MFRGLMFFYSIGPKYERRAVVEIRTSGLDRVSIVNCEPFVALIVIGALRVYMGHVSLCLCVDVDGGRSPRIKRQRYANLCTPVN